MEVFDGYGAKVTINNLTNGEESPSGYFALLRKLDVTDGGAIELGISLASRAQCSGHEALANKLYGSSMTAQLPDEFPYDKVELRSWIDCIGTFSTIRLKGFREIDSYFSPDETRKILTRIGAVAISSYLCVPVKDLDAVMSFSPSELREMWPSLRDSIYI